MFGYISENVVKNISPVFGCMVEMLFSYNNKNQNHTESTFSHIFSPAKQIYNFIPQFRNTNKTQEKKFIIRSNWEKKEEKEDDRFWGRGRSVLGCDESGFAIGEDESVLRLRSRSGWRRSRTAKSKGEVERRRRTTKSKGEVERRRRTAKDRKSVV